MLDPHLPPGIVPDLSAAILSALDWCSVGITMPDEHLRERAADELARAIVSSLNPQVHDRDQLRLAL